MVLPRAKNAEMWWPKTRVTGCADGESCPGLPRAVGQAKARPRRWAQAKREGSCIPVDWRGFWCKLAMIAHLAEDVGEDIRNQVGTEVPENGKFIPSVKWEQ